MSGAFKLFTAIVGVLLCIAIGLGVAYVWTLHRAVERSRNERSHRAHYAIGALKTIRVSESIYRERTASAGKPSYATLAELSSSQLIDSVLGSGTKGGYLFRVAPSATTPEFLWFGTAEPPPSDPPLRSFCINQDGVIFYTTAGPIALDTVACEIPPSALPLGR